MDTISLMAKGDSLRAKVRSRLNALGINAFEAARKMGAHREFVHSLLDGRKDRIGSDKIGALAAVLQIDVNELIAAQMADEPPPATVVPVNQFPGTMTRRTATRPVDADVLELLLRGAFQQMRLDEEQARTLARGLIREARSATVRLGSEQAEDQIRETGAVLARLFVG